LSKAKGVIGILFHESVSKVALLVADLQHILKEPLNQYSQEENIPETIGPSQRKFFPAYNFIG
jgi:hypothetical protein